MFYPRLTWPYVVGALSFHACIYLTMQINFFPYWGLSFLIFLDWPTLRTLTAPWSAFAPRKPALSRSERQPCVPAICGDSLAARAVILGLWSVLAVCIYARIESWPFSDYRVFAGRNRFDEVRVFRLAATDAAGRTEWVPRRWMPLSPTSFNRRIHAHLGQRDDVSLSSMLGDLAEYVARYNETARYKSLVVVERTLEVDPRTGMLLVIDRPIREANVARTNRSPMDTLRWAMGSLPDDSAEYGELTTPY